MHLRDTRYGASAFSTSACTLFSVTSTSVASLSHFIRLYLRSSATNLPSPSELSAIARPLASLSLPYPPPPPSLRYAVVGATSALRQREPTNRRARKERKRERERKKEKNGEIFRRREYRDARNGLRYEKPISSADPVPCPRT